MHAAPTTMTHTSHFPGSFNFTYFQPSLNAKCKVLLMREQKIKYRLTCLCCPDCNESHQVSSRVFFSFFSFFSTSSISKPP